MSSTQKKMQQNFNKTAHQLLDDKLGYEISNKFQIQVQEHDNNDNNEKHQGTCGSIKNIVTNKNIHNENIQTNNFSIRMLIHNGQNSGNFTQQIQQMNEENQSQFDYYEQYKKIYLISYHLYLQKIKRIQIRLSCEKRIKLIEQKLKDIQKLEQPKKDSEQENRIKRSRRTADQIQRKFKCQVQFCQRCYGSEGSLQQHIKLKHPDLYKKYQNQGKIILNTIHIDSYDS